MVNHRQQLDCHAPLDAEFRPDPLRHQLSLVLPPTLIKVWHILPSCQETMRIDKSI
jgi:hypothetical protein